MFRKCLLLSIVLLIILTLPACGPAAEAPTIEEAPTTKGAPTTGEAPTGEGEEDKVVTFPDEVLEEEVRHAIGKPKGPI